MMLMLLASLAASAGLFAFYRTDTVHAESERATNEALAAAKTALIGYAVARGGPTGIARPGELPCPDTNGDGVAESACTSAASLLGRLPWKTLGIPQLVDSAGEPLWYALSPAFRPVATAPTPSQRINSDTHGTIFVLAADGSTVLTNQAAAVIFAPGAATGAQNRAAAASATASNYLDAIEGTNNAASSAGPFIAGSAAATFNDRLTYFTATEFMPAVEMRIGNELKALLTAYRLKSNCQCYPWADTWPYSGGIADVSQNRGRFPTEPVPEEWGSGNIPALPEWLGANNWHNLFWYSVSRRASADPAGCRTCSTDATLTVDSSIKVAALFFTPGTPRPQDFPPGTPLDEQVRLPQSPDWQKLTWQQRARSDNLGRYLQDDENNNGSACPDVGEIGGDAPSYPVLRTGGASCDRYVTPTETLRDRDRLYMLGAATAATCRSNGLALAAAAPCGTAWTITNPVCQATMPNLDACTCASAARVLARPPCTNVIEPGQCETALAQVKTCTQ
jgi:hypothetical protein